MFVFDYFRLYNPSIKPILIKPGGSNLCLFGPTSTRQQLSGQFCRCVTPSFVETILYHPYTSHQRRFSGFLFSRIFLFILFIHFLFDGVFYFFKDFLSSHPKIFIPRWIVFELFSIVKNVLPATEQWQIWAVKASPANKT